MGSNVRFAFPRLTPVVRTLLIALGAVFFAQVIVAASLDGGAGAAGRADRWIAEHFGVWWPGFVSGRIWQPVTYTLLHSTQDIGHLLMNGVVLYFFGTMAESRLGTKVFWKLFIGAGITGGVFVVAADAFRALALGHEQFATVVGASGATSGVMAAVCWLWWDRWLSLFFLRLKGRHLLLLVVGIDVLRVLMGSPISLAAHLGGVVFGLGWLSGKLNPQQWWLRWRLTRTRSKLEVLDGGRRDDGPTVH